MRVEQGRTLAAASERVHYIELRNEDHITLPLRVDLLGGVVDDWLAHDDHIGGRCPSPALPAEADRLAMARAVAGRAG